MDLLCAERLSHSYAFKDAVIFTDERVLNELLNTEGNYVPIVNYLEDRVQTDITPNMRKILTKWMLEVCEDLQLETQVFPLAVNLLDRYLCYSSTPSKFLQLLASSCILVAAKIRQSVTISLRTLCSFALHTITPAQMKDYEFLLVSKLKWDLLAVTAYDYVDHLLYRIRWSKHEKIIRKHTFVLVQLCCTDDQFMLVRPSVVAAACIVSAVKGLKMKSELDDILNRLCSLTRKPRNEIEKYANVIDRFVNEVRTNEIFSSRSTAAVITPPKQKSSTVNPLKRPYESVDGNRVRRTVTTAPTTSTSGTSTNTAGSSGNSISDSFSPKNLDYIFGAQQSNEPISSDIVMNGAMMSAFEEFLQETVMNGNADDIIGAQSISNGRRSQDADLISRPTPSASVVMEPIGYCRFFYDGRNRFTPSPGQPSSTSYAAQSPISELSPSYRSYYLDSSPDIGPDGGETPPPSPTRLSDFLNV